MFNISWYGTSTRPDGIWNTKTYSVVFLFLPPREDEPSECRDDEDEGGERGWKGALGNARVELGARGGIIKEAGNAKEAVTLSALCVSSVWPRMRGRLSLQFSRLGRQLRSPVSCSLSCAPIVAASPFRRPSRKKVRASDRACTSVDTFTWHF